MADKKQPPKQSNEKTKRQQRNAENLEKLDEAIEKTIGLVRTNLKGDENDHQRGKEDSPNWYLIHKLSNPRKI